MGWTMLRRLEVGREDLKTEIRYTCLYFIAPQSQERTRVVRDYGGKRWGRGMNDAPLHAVLVCAFAGVFKGFGSKNHVTACLPDRAKYRQLGYFIKLLTARKWALLWRPWVRILGYFFLPPWNTGRHASRLLFNSLMAATFVGKFGSRRVCVEQMSPPLASVRFDRPSKRRRRRRQAIVRSS